MRQSKKKFENPELEVVAGNGLLHRRALLERGIVFAGAAITAADGGSPVSTDLDAVCAELEPFAPLDIGQFAAFLRQAEQYRNSGAVSVPSLADLGAEVRRGDRARFRTPGTIDSMCGLIPSHTYPKPAEAH